MSFKGHLLVAHPNMMDPNFHNAVVLVTKEEKGNVAGLILNRAGPVTIKSLWEDSFKEKMDVEGWVHSGGPVYGTPMALHTTQKFSDEIVMPGIFLTYNKDSIKKLLLEGEQYRIFLGYAGWQPGQLERELDVGAWFLAQADIGDVFYTYGDDLYKKYMQTITVEMMNAIVPELTREHFKNAPYN